MNRTALCAAMLVLAFVARAEAATVVADAGPDQTVAVGAEGTGTATLDGSKSTDSSGATFTLAWTGPFSENAGQATGLNPTVTLPLGENVITLTVTNATGETATDTVTITVADQTAPTISKLTPDPRLLWPPNHKMIEVTVTADTFDAVDKAPVCKIVSVTSNEPDNGIGDGNTVDDIEITGDLTVNLRAERAGPGSGRIYTITVECTDEAGNVTTGEALVKVPHDKRQYKAEVESEDDGAADGSTDDGGSDKQKGKGHGNKNKGNKNKGKGKGKGNGKGKGQSSEMF